MSKNVSKSVPTCFEHVLRWLLWKQFTLEGQDLEKIQKNRKFLKISKMSKNVPKSVLNMFWTCWEVIFSIFLAQCTLENWDSEKIQ